MLTGEDGQRARQSREQKVTAVRGVLTEDALITVLYLDRGPTPRTRLPWKRMEGLVSRCQLPRYKACLSDWKQGRAPREEVLPLSLDLKGQERPICEH